MKRLLFSALAVAAAIALAACNSGPKDSQIPEDADEYLQQIMDEPYAADQA